MEITPATFFRDLFPCSYVCATAESGAQFDGSVPCLDYPEKPEQALPRYQKLNLRGHNIFFTPNQAQAAAGKNRLDNLAQINAWYIDIDTKSDLAARNDKKGEVLTQIFMHSLWPSLTIETRNGYHLYWLSDGTATEKNWETIERGIFEYFEPVGADRSTTKIMQLMRVPKMYFYKKGEKGMIEFIPYFSTLRYHGDEEMLAKFPASLKPQNSQVSSAVYTPTIIKVNDIFTHVVSLPIADVLAKLSGTTLVKNDILTLQYPDKDKTNVLANGRVSPNWIIKSTNQIFSNNADPSGPTILQFLQWYHGPRWAMIAEELKKIFTS